MRIRPILAASGLLALGALGACANSPPTVTTGGAPVGTDASSGAPALSPTALGPGDINRNYYIGSNPNFPGGSGGATGPMR